MISGRDTLCSEKISIEYRHGKVLYILVVTGQNNGEAVVFTLVDVKSGQWVFVLSILNGRGFIRE